MTCKTVLKYLTCVALAGGTWALTAAERGARAGGGLPDMTVPESFGMQLKPPQTKVETLDATMDTLQDLGVKWVRRGFYWESIEKTPGTYDFAEYDRLFKTFRARGISVIGCLFGDHSGYVDESKKATHLTEKGRQGYAKFAAACAEHFKDDNVLWEIWNEPNTMTFWGRHGKTGNSEQYAEEYLALVKATVPAMKQANPQCYILGGSVSNMWTESYKWQTYCFKKGMLSTGIDAWSVHPYGLGRPEDYIAAYGIVRKLATDAGAKPLPMLNTERGFPVDKKAEGFAGGEAGLQFEYQAWHLVRQYLVDQLCDIKMTSWYELGGTEGFALYKGEQKFPAYKACKVLTQQLAGYKLDQRIDLASPKDFVLRYVNKNGGVKLVAWTCPPKGDSPDGAKKHDVEVPVEAAGTLDGASIYGEAQKIEVKDGKATLTLSGGPQYVTVRSGK